MLIRNPWPAAGARMALVALGSAFVGLVSGYPLACLLAGFVGYGAYHVYHLVRLERWLRHGRLLRPPEASGLWEALFDSLYRRQRRHRKRRKRLAKLLRRFKDSANAIPDATVVLRGQGQMQWWNAAATQYLGLRWPQDANQHIANLFRHPHFNEFLARGDRNESVKVPSPVDERRVLEVRLVPYGGQRQLLLARDVTRLHRLEIMRRDFVANITHELRTPLTVIQGLAETLSDYGVSQPSDLEQPLALIEQQTQRMGRLIDDLLLLSRLETGEREGERPEVDVSNLLKTLAEEGRALSDGRHRISVDTDDKLVLDGDEDELRSAFSNLIVNAVKYTPTGGHVDIRWFEAAGEACVAVADTGEGIPSHHLPRLTERFYRVDEGRASRAGGTGLGLAIAKHVLSRHGARLDIRSQVGEGSTFTCVFSYYRRSGQPHRAVGSGD